MLDDLFAALSTQISTSDYDSFKRLINEQDSAIERQLDCGTVGEALKGSARTAALVLLLLPTDTESGEEQVSLYEQLDEPIRTFAHQAAHRLLHKLLKSLASNHRVLSLAANSLLTGLLHSRPHSTLSTVLPVMIGCFEELLSTSANASLQHALKCSLASVMSSAVAEPYYPIVMDALEKAPRLTRQKRSLEDQSGDSDEEPDSYTSKRQQVVVDILRIPLATVIDILIGSLQYVSLEQLPDIIERWRPTSSVVPDQPKVTVDPRRREEPQQQQPKYDIVGRSRPRLSPDQLIQRITKIVTDKMISKGIPITEQFNSHTNYGVFVGRLVCSVEQFGVDLYDDLLDACFQVSSSLCNTSQQSIVSAYLRMLWFCGKEEDYLDKMIKGMVIVPLEQLGPFCFGLPVIDYPNLVAVLRQHVVAAEGTSKCDPKKTYIVMQLVKQLRVERPRDEWEALKDFLIECCQSSDVILRGLSVEQGVDLLDSTSARQIMYSTSDMSLETKDISDGQKLDLAMAMTRKDPLLLTDLMEFQQSAYFMAKLPVLFGLLDNELTCDLISTDTLIKNQQLWVRLLSLKNGPVNKAVYSKLISNVTSGLLPVIIDRAPVDCVADWPLFINTTISLLTEQSEEKWIEFGVDGMGPEAFLLNILTLPLHNFATEKMAMQCAQTCLTMAKAFKGPLLMNVFSNYIDSDNRPTVVFMRTFLLALTLHKTSCSPSALSLLHRLQKTVSQDPLMNPLFLKAIKILLPNSLNLLAGMPEKMLMGALAVEGELRKPVKEYLYGLPPSIRSRYGSILHHLE